MVTEREHIGSLAEAAAVLAPPVAPGCELLVVVSRSVPPWLAELAQLAAGAGATVLIEAQAPAEFCGEERAGWEIGVVTAALTAGATDVVGVDPQRVARVREIIDALAAGADPIIAPVAEAAP